MENGAHYQEVVVKEQKEKAKATEKRTIHTFRCNNGGIRRQKKEHKNKSTKKKLGGT